ncbi:response regulator [Lutispora sp.]|uniref:response regulator n=1 Tax=Lutispora sp. TaxID=2828727 RepID=UPI0035699FC8
MNTICVLLADNQTIIRDGLRALLEACPDIQVIAEANNGRQAYEMVIEHHPDVVLMDIRMPEVDGVDATRLIKDNFPETTVIILTTFDDDEYIINAMTCGASGYLLKDIGGEKLIEAIRDGVRGNIILPGRIAAKITSRLVQNQTSKVELDDFTEREKEIIKLLVLGKSNREIAQILLLSVGTVKNYISQIYSKANINDRTNAVLLFKKIGL